MHEIWKDIEGYEGLYQVSNLGRVKGLNRTIIKATGTSKQAVFELNEHIKTSQKLTRGYMFVVLYKNGKPKTKLIHRLVAEAFLPNPKNKPEVNHIDGNKENNCIDNLEWATSKENLLHASKNGLLRPHKEPVLQLDDDGNIIAEYESVTAASLKTGATVSNICCVCKGKRKTKAGGYYWAYKGTRTIS